MVSQRAPKKHRTMSQTNLTRLAFLLTTKMRRERFFLGSVAIDKPVDALLQVADVEGVGEVLRLLDFLGRFRRPSGHSEPGEKGCGKEARSASLEIAARFPLSHSRGDGGPSVTLQMARRSTLRLHS